MIIEFWSVWRLKKLTLVNTKKNFNYKAKDSIESMHNCGTAFNHQLFLRRLAIKKNLFLYIQLKTFGFKKRSLISICTNFTRGLVVRVYCLYLFFFLDHVVYSFGINQNKKIKCWQLKWVFEVAKRVVNDRVAKLFRLGRGSDHSLYYTILITFKNGSKEIYHILIYLLAFWLLYTFIITSFNI